MQKPPNVHRSLRTHYPSIHVNMLLLAKQNNEIDQKKRGGGMRQSGKFNCFSSTPKMNSLVFCSDPTPVASHKMIHFSTHLRLKCSCGVSDSPYVQAAQYQCAIPTATAHPKTHINTRLFDFMLGDVAISQSTQRPQSKHPTSRAGT